MIIHFFVACLILKDLLIHILIDWNISNYGSIYIPCFTWEEHSILIQCSFDDISYIPNFLKSPALLKQLSTCSCICYNCSLVTQTYTVHQPRMFRFFCKCEYYILAGLLWKAAAGAFGTYWLVQVYYLSCCCPWNHVMSCFNEKDMLHEPNWKYNLLIPDCPHDWNTTMLIQQHGSVPSSGWCWTFITHWNFNLYSGAAPHR